MFQQCNCHSLSGGYSYHPHFIGADTERRMHVVPKVMGLVSIRNGIQLFTPFIESSDLLLPFLSARDTDPENSDDLFRIIRVGGEDRGR